MKDSRPTIFAVVLCSPELTYREKCYLLAVTTLRTEYVDGKRRPGSKEMDRRGRYSLHLDYIARGMGGTVAAVRETRRALVGKRWLDKIHKGTYGRPDAYQVLHDRADSEPLRVRDFYTLTDTQKPNPYGESNAPTRVHENHTLTCSEAPNSPMRLPESSLLRWLPNGGQQGEQWFGSAIEVTDTAAPGWDSEESA